MATDLSGVNEENTLEATRHAFQEGDFVLLVDRKGRRYLLRLESNGAFHTHFGVLPHREVIGQKVGCRINLDGHKLLALRPTLTEYIQKSRRATQILYAKDLGAILAHADVFPGARVLEAGLGSGALTLTLLRAVGPQGLVISYELRPEVAEQTMTNIRPMMPESAKLEVHNADVYDGISELDLDRVFLDVPEPWQVVGHAAEALAPGGLLLSFIPTVLQVHQLVETLNQHPNFDLVETFEVLERPWHVTRRSVRPQHRMVAHTGFITTARKCAPGKLLPLEERLSMEGEPEPSLDPS